MGGEEHRRLAQGAARHVQFQSDHPQLGRERAGRLSSAARSAVGVHGVSALDARQPPGRVFGQRRIAEPRFSVSGEGDQCPAVARPTRGVRAGRPPPQCRGESLALRRRYGPARRHPSTSELEHARDLDTACADPGRGALRRLQRVEQHRLAPSQHVRRPGPALRHHHGQVVRERGPVLAHHAEAQCRGPVAYAHARGGGRHARTESGRRTRSHASCGRRQLSRAACITTTTAVPRTRPSSGRANRRRPTPAGSARTSAIAGRSRVG